MNKLFTIYLKFEKPICLFLLEILKVLSGKNISIHFKSGN